MVMMRIIVKLIRQNICRNIGLQMGLYIHTQNGATQKHQQNAENVIQNETTD